MHTIADCLRQRPRPRVTLSLICGCRCRSGGHSPLLRLRASYADDAEGTEVATCACAATAYGSAAIDAVNHGRRLVLPRPRLTLGHG
jgi:hypothetical protein